ncbi:ATP-binding protein [Nocardioides caricicola]
MDRDLVERPNPDAATHDARTDVRTDARGSRPVTRRVETTLRLEAEPQSARTARHAVRDLCANVPPPPISEDRADVAALLTTELVANAVIHSGKAAVLDAVVADRTLRVAVSDTSDDQPAPRSGAQRAADAMTGSRDEGESGRGLFLVDELADRWGWHPHRDGAPGKTVWFELDVA